MADTLHDVMPVWEQYQRDKMDIANTLQLHIKQKKTSTSEFQRFSKNADK